MITRSFGEIVWMCDECGEELPTDTMDFGDALDVLRENSWVARKDDGHTWEHFCEDCK